MLAGTRIRKIVWVVVAVSLAVLIGRHYDLWGARKTGESFSSAARGATPTTRSSGRTRRSVADAEWPRWGAAETGVSIPPPQDAPDAADDRQLIVLFSDPIALDVQEVSFTAGDGAAIFADSGVDVEALPELPGAANHHAALMTD